MIKTNVLPLIHANDNGTWCREDVNGLMFGFVVKSVNVVMDHISFGC